MKQLIPSVIISSLLLTACSSDSSTESNDVVQTESVSENNSSPSVSQANSCLADYQAEPWSLFSLEQVAEFVGLPAADGKMDEPMLMKNHSSRAAGYKWDTGRTMTTEITGDMQIPVSDTVTIGRFEILDPETINGTFVDHFRNQYRVPSDQQQAEFETALAKQLENESELTQKFSEGISNISKSINYQTIAGIGSAAAWQTNLKSPDGLLHVLHDNLTFVVVTNLSDDRHYNLEVAKKIALAILEKC